MSSYWDKRYEVHGHTGWSDSVLYEYDQKARLNAIEEKINDLNFSRFLDIGCGSGDFVQLCLSKKNHPSGFGIDISKKAVDALKDKFKSSPQIQFQQVDLTKHTFPSQEFDLIICITVLQHLGDDEKIIAAIRSIKSSMKPDGHFVLLENIYGDVKADNGGYIRTNISSEKWKYLLIAGGMEVSDVGTYNHWGVVLTESIQSLVAKFSSRRYTPTKHSLDISSASRIDSNSYVKKIVRKLIFWAAYVLDYVLKIPIPKVWRRYEIFICTR
jgi:2-polyprenyl-3-methyl-5-hydroxy-6-metoxy-1,4-benzoquinol methylase